MSEGSPPGAAENPPVDRAQALSPARIDALLADFRAWLEQAGQEPAPTAASTEEPLSLHTLLGQFVALRHEINLQTKAVRAQQEQNAQTLTTLQQAVEALQQTESEDDEDDEPDEMESLRPLFKAMVDVADLFGLARREVQRVQETLAGLLTPPSAPVAPRPGFLARLFGASASLPAENPEREQAAARAHQLIESIVTGYTMSLQRLERVLREQGLEPLRCKGEPFDPERMEVVEAAVGTGRPSGEVLEEVRPGWLWNGRVFRFAQVRVAKS